MINRRFESHALPQRISRSPQVLLFGPQLRLKLFTLCLFLLLQMAATGIARAQENCPPIPDAEGESISAEITIASTGATVTHGMVVPAYTQLRIDSLATAHGTCHAFGWECPNGTCQCVEIASYNRTINHTNVWADIATSGGLNGTYTVGSVYGRNPDGTTAFLNELDTHSSDSTGPLYFTVSYPGTYRFYVQGIINTTICNIQPGVTDIFTIDVIVGDPLPINNGSVKDCYQTVGEPVNVTNGNMYLQQTDYQLPGVGKDLGVTRTYNSLGQSQSAGLFGNGWSTAFDESVTAYGSRLLRLNLADGRAIYLTREAETSPYYPQQPLDFRGTIIKNGDGSYTLSLKDGSTHHFNAAGKLASLTDPNNNQTTLTYGTGGRLTTITDPVGRTLTLDYTTDGMVSSISDSLGVVSTYTYDYLFSIQFFDWVYRLRTVTYPDGSQFKFTYDYPNRLTTVQDALDHVLESHTYDSQGRALTSEKQGGVEHYTLSYLSGTETDVQDALGHVTKYFFDTSKGRNLLTRVEGSCGCGGGGGGSQVQTWTYDNQLNVTSKTDALNHTTAYTYDANGNLLTMTNALGTVTLTYNSLGEVLTLTDPMQGVTTNTYDAHGNLLTAKDALNHTTTLTYDAHGQLLTIKDARDKTTTLTWDSSGRLTQVQDAANHSTTFAYDGRSRVTGATNALNETTNYEYDVAGRPNKVIYADASYVQYTYDLGGRLTKIRDARGHETNLAYDAANRLTSVTNADNQTTSYAYNLMSRLTGTTDALNRTTNYEYDNFNRLVKTIYPAATAGATRLEASVEYDLAGNVKKRRDMAGRETLYDYDAANRLTEVTDPALQATQYEYNARSQMTAVVDALNQRYEFAYDALGRVTQVTRGGLSMSYQYDAVGSRTSRTDYNNQTTTYAYDELNRLATVTYPDATTVSYTYDTLSRLTSATNQSGTVSFSYDNRGRVSSTTGVDGTAVNYSYDANDNRTQLSLGQTVKASYQYDVLDRVTQLTDGGSAATTFTYDAADKLTSRTLPNGVTADYQYDGLDRLTRLQQTKGANTLADYQYQYNAANNLTQLTDLTGTHAYAYDSIDRLTSATHPNASAESYAYDSVGNRTASHFSTTYGYQPFNRLTTIGSTSYSYDNNGNLTQKIDAAGTWTYAWDYENRLKLVTRPDGTTISYKYDAFGRRIRRSKSSEWTKYVYDGEDVVKDISSDGSTVDYLNGLGVDDKLRQTSSAGTLYFAQDHLNSTRVLTDNNGSVVESVNYDSFGNGASSLTRYSSTGREWDDDANLYYYRARWYDPQAGRFISEDPVAFDGGINFYAYVGNDPLNYNDPSGLCPCAAKNKVAGALLYTGAAFFSDGANRGIYERNVKLIDTTDPFAASLTRLSHQDTTYSRMTPLGRSFSQIERDARDLARPPLGLNRAAGSAGRSSAAVNKVGRAFKYAGGILTAAGAGLSLYRIISAEPCERGRVMAEEAGGWAGSLAYGYAGAKIFGAIGTAIGGPIGGVIGSVIGGIGGGIYGYEQGETAGAEYYRAFKGDTPCPCR